ncbi:hypothetical protein CCR94_20130 [Rhodoblastus sphagnicola]|uniref:Uncharacterized protein n=1 Tax=Rhodoblastus sphagnicola TaxID=333368 RepID=A0A2S6MYI6_9HYPH|nr:hypothetical protein [Rhodoblastus sphagnicola]MBB4200801.1 hypothetical protein [Rhodoblastus sphagnicola]PPQ27421.1 hypothetical protein CCR94_20130 [Rhodoblastus sphagnicola]
MTAEEAKNGPHVHPERSRARGESTPSVDDIVDHLLAPLHLRSLVGLPVDKEFAEGLANRLMRAQL